MPNSLFPAANSAQRAAPGRAKIALEPGHSPLDWAALNSTKKTELRGLPPGAPPAQFLKVPHEELKKHKTKEDAWTCINGKVFNISPYVSFHPGGETEIMKCAGRDGTALFNKYHSWVSADRMLANCCVGMLDQENRS